MLPRQETFDRVLTHLRTQGVPAYEDGQCSYRTDNGLMCAIGALIPDENYISQMDCGHSVGEELVWKRVPGATKRDVPFLRLLQSAHDGSVIDSLGPDGNYLESVERRMAAIAKRFRIKYEEPSS